MSTRAAIAEKALSKTEIVRRYLDGERLVPLARACQCKASTISMVLREAGIDVHQMQVGRSADARRLRPIHAAVAKNKGITAKLSDSEWAYIAGIFDGEGCLSEEQSNQILRSFRIGITQKDKALLDWLVSILGVGSIGFQGRSRKVRQYRICAQREVYHFLRGTQPYLIVKAEKVNGAVATLEARYGWEN